MIPPSFQAVDSLFGGVTLKFATIIATIVSFERNAILRSRRTVIAASI